MASFTTVLDELELDIPVKGTSIDIAISGTYDMTILFQRELGSKGSGSWETINTYNTANATVAAVYTSIADRERVRLIVTVDTSGTATATLTDNDNKGLSYHTVKDGNGNNIVEYFEGGVRHTGAMERASGNYSIEAAATLTAAEHAGRTGVFNIAAGVTVTLPAATGTGNIYRFFVGVTVTSVNDVIQVANATDEFLGTLVSVDTDTADAVVGWPALDGDGFDTITLNGSTKGGLMGDFIEIEDVASGKFRLSGHILGTGTVVTPLSAAV